MLNYYALMVGDETEKGAQRRLEQFVYLLPLEIYGQESLPTKGDVVLVSGKTLDQISEAILPERLESWLRAGVSVIIIGAVQSSRILLRGLSPFDWPSAETGLVSLVDEQLLTNVGMDQLKILYTQVLQSSWGTVLAQTADGKPVALGYQHRSTWGRLICTSLLLGSASARSNSTHRGAFLRGLVAWLQPVSSAIPVKERAAAAPEINLSPALPGILLGLALIVNPQFEAEDFDSAYKKVAHLLNLPSLPGPVETILPMLEQRNLAFMKNENHWTVDQERLSDLISQEQLGPYLRRLR